MALINQNSIIGLTSITSPSASNVLTVHTNDTTERLRVSTSGLSFSGTNASLDTSGNATFNGNVSIGGTLTYEDVTNIDSVGIITAQSDVSIADKIIHTGDTDTAIRFPAVDTFSVETGGSERVRITSAGIVRIPDNGKFTAGDNDDLQISHDGATSIISGMYHPIELRHQSEVHIKCVDDGAVSLYHNNVPKLETTTTGATITSDLILDHASGDKAIRWATGGTNKWSLYHNNGAGALVAFDNANNAERLRITSAGDVEPGADATQDLGSATKRWANIYSADLQLSNEGAANDVDGTWGKYTIQEGEEDLFLINKRSGKKYKFMLQEVN
jgi:hypothetical protein